MSASPVLLVYGAGGHGRVIAEMASGCGFSLLGFIDDALSLQRTTVAGLPVLGNRTWLQTLASPGYAVALAIGDNGMRMSVASFLAAHGIALATVISRSAVVAGSARIGAGTVIMPGALVNAGAVVGEGAVLNTGSIVEHDVIVGDYAHISPGAILGGGACVGPLAHIAMGAIVLPGVRIGTRTTLGAGSLAPKDLPDAVVAFGSPARVRRSAGSMPAPREPGSRGEAMQGARA